jgi:CheY-like chemotaxis protein
MNLLVNARDAMPAGGHLHVGTRRVTVDGAPGPLAAPLAPGNYVLLSVTDTGCGMTPEVQQRIFEPFFTTKDVGKGTGLGLAHVYGIVQQHRGTIHVSSAPGHGTTFQIYLPTVERESDGEPPQSLVPATAGARAGARAETILLAEDEPIVRELAVRMLTAAGYTVLEAADGEEAVRLFAEHRERIALSLLDVVMPRLDGHAAFRRMCEAQPDARVIFCTGYDPETARTEGLIEARHPLIEKPYSPQVLLNTVRRVIDAEASCLVA